MLNKKTKLASIVLASLALFSAVAIIGCNDSSETTEVKTDTVMAMPDTTTMVTDTTTFTDSAETRPVKTPD